MKVGRKLANKILNVSKFVLGFGDVAGDAAATDAVDLAMLARLDAVIVDATTAFDGFDYARALERTEEFFWWFCDDYVELVKSRAYGSRGDGAATSARVGVANGRSRRCRRCSPHCCRSAPKRRGVGGTTAASTSLHGRHRPAPVPTRRRSTRCSRCSPSSAGRRRRPRSASGRTWPRSRSRRPPSARRHPCRRRRPRRRRHDRRLVARRRATSCLCDIELAPPNDGRTRRYPAARWLTRTANLRPPCGPSSARTRGQKVAIVVASIVTFLCFATAGDVGLRSVRRRATPGGRHREPGRGSCRRSDDLDGDRDARASRPATGRRSASTPRPRTAHREAEAADDVPRGRSGRQELPRHRRRQRVVHRSRLAVRASLRRPQPARRAQRHDHGVARRSGRRPGRRAVAPTRPVGDDRRQRQPIADQLRLPAQRAAAPDRHDLRELRRSASTTTSRSTSAPSRRSSTPSAACPCRSTCPPATPRPASTCRRPAASRSPAITPSPTCAAATTRCCPTTAIRRVNGVADGPELRSRSHLAPAGLHAAPARQGAQPWRTQPGAWSAACTSTMTDYVVTDNELSLRKMLEFAGVLRAIDPDGIPSYQIASSRATIAGNSVLHPRAGGVRDARRARPLPR